MILAEYGVCCRRISSPRRATLIREQFPQIAFQSPCTEFFSDQLATPSRTADCAARTMLFHQFLPETFGRFQNTAVPVTHSKQAITKFLPETFCTLAPRVAGLHSAASSRPRIFSAREPLPHRASLPPRICSSYPRSLAMSISTSAFSVSGNMAP